MSVSHLWAFIITWNYFQLGKQAVKKLFSLVAAFFAAHKTVTRNLVCLRLLTNYPTRHDPDNNKDLPTTGGHFTVPVCRETENLNRNRYDSL